MPLRLPGPIPPGMLPQPNPAPPWYNPSGAAPKAPEQELDFESLLREALGVARTEYDANAPLREKARGFLSGPIPAPRNLSDVFADESNPYARQVPRPPRGPGAGLPTPPGGAPGAPGGGLDALHDALGGALGGRPQNPAPLPTPPAYPTPPRRRTLL